MDSGMDISDQFLVNSIDVDLPKINDKQVYLVITNYTYYHALANTPEEAIDIAKAYFTHDNEEVMTTYTTFKVLIRKP